MAPIIDPRKVAWQLAGIQFCGAFNAFGFVTVAVLSACTAGNSFFDQSSLMVRMLFAYIAPIMLLPGIAGLVADRYSKRNVLTCCRVAEVAIMLGGVFTLQDVTHGGELSLIYLLLLLGIKNAFGRAAGLGYLPEVCGEKGVSLGNGLTNFTGALGIITGLASGFALNSLMQSYPQIHIGSCGWLFLGVAVLGATISFQLPGREAANPGLKWHVPNQFDFTGAFHYLSQKKTFSFAIAAEVLFGIYLSFCGMLLIINVRHQTEYSSFEPIDLCPVLIFPCLGLAVGGLVAAWFSRRRLELGVVPFGALGMMIFPLFFTSGFTPALAYHAHPVFPLLLIWVTLAGFSAGLFIVPVRQHLQQTSSVATRGILMAYCGSVLFFSCAATLLLVFVLAVFLHVKSDVLYWALAVLVASVSGTIFFRHPEFIFRMFMILLKTTFFRIKTTGTEKIPEHGPAVLIANHVSFIDGFFITDCTSRRVHFMMHEDFYRFPLLYPFVRWAGFIEVPAAHKVKQMQLLFRKVQRMLSQGRIICIFPEGGVTKNGIMQGFKSGISRMLPPNLDVPVIPVRLGMLWGSIFTTFNGRLKFLPPKELPIPVSITVGDRIPSGLTAYQARGIMSELGAEAEKEIRDHEMPLHYHFAKRAKRHPFRQTFYDHDGKPVTNFSLLVRAILLSREIRKLVPDKTQYVGVMLPNCSAGVATLLAVMMADKTPAVLNFTSSRAVLESAIDKAEITCILTSRTFLNKLKMDPFPQMVMLEDVARGIGKARQLWVALVSAIVPTHELMNYVSPESHDDVQRIAALIFSSGSSGDPKGVMLSHHNFNSDVFSFWRVIGWRKDDRIIGNLPFFHSFGMMVCFWLPAMSGIEVVLTPNPLDTATICRVIEKWRITLITAPPTFLQAYMRRGTKQQLASLRLVITGAEKLRADIARKFKEMTGLAVVEGYGCTELAPIVSINLSNSIFTLGVCAGKYGSIGVAMPGICVRIVDPVTREPVAEGCDGLMLVKGGNVMVGYLKDPQLTAEVIQDGWYNTGDIGHMDSDGYITITGRMSRFSKIGGEMVPHELVEMHINEILETEDRCVVVTDVADERKGERLVVLYSMADLNSAAIVEQLRATGLPNLWIPKAEDFFYTDKIPLLGSGKVDLKKTRELISQMLAAAS